MESITYGRNLKISPKKLRFLLLEIKNLKPVDALDHLMYTAKRSAEIFYKVIKSAVSDAKNVLKVDEKMFRFKHLSVEDGQRLKRSRSGGRGTVKSILRRFAHIKIILEVEEQKEINQRSKIKDQNDISNIKNTKIQKTKVKIDAKRHPELVSGSR
ncbi:hypothetical protein HY612_00250 [Candidatus Roizmanbacteria bacterium]|nr:hypothetical protein [Candidatus Roizmanbacteria bacterium]